MIEVVAGVIVNSNNKILIGKRKKGKFLEGYWEFPGGKVELRENPKESLKRELREELSIEIAIEDYIGMEAYSYDKIEINLIAYRCSIIKGNINLIDHEEVVWEDVNNLKKYKIAPADLFIVNRLIGNQIE